MKNLLLCIVLAFALLGTNANPLPLYPIVITELHCDNNGNWVIELQNTFDSFSGVTDLNNVRLTTSSGSYYFKQGINLEPYQLFLVNNDSLTSPILINRDGDFINIEIFQGIDWSPTGFPLSFGINASEDIGPISLNQSIELYNYSYLGPDDSYMYVKSTTSSLGGYPSSNLSSMGVFQGFIYDRNNNPITTRQIQFTSYYPFPDFHNISVNQQTGYFNLTSYSKRYQVHIQITGATNPYIDSCIVIEPGQTTNCTFHLDFVDGINDLDNPNLIQISNYPNPVSDNTNFTFSLPSLSAFSKGIIKIYNSNGEIIKILPVISSYFNDNKYLIPLNIRNDNNFVSGVYYYSLEINGKKICSNKMTIIK
jgi:hypothetical protein